LNDTYLNIYDIDNISYIINQINLPITKMLANEHPKSAVYRLIAQKCNQSKECNSKFKNVPSIYKDIKTSLESSEHRVPTISVHDPEFSHEYKQVGNKNIFKCSVVVIVDGKTHKFTSNDFLNKKDCEYDVFKMILEFLEGIFKNGNKQSTLKSLYTPPRNLPHTVSSSTSPFSPSLYSQASTSSSLSKQNSKSELSSSSNSDSISTSTSTSSLTLNSPIISKANSTCTTYSSTTSTSLPQSISKVKSKSAPNSNLSLDTSSNFSTLTPSSNKAVDRPVQKTASIFDLLEVSDDLSNDIIIIVDFENVQKLDQLALLYDVVIPDKDIHIVKIAGFCSCVKHNADIVVRSNRKDAVDHYISYLIGLLESGKTYPIIYVITRDKFGSCLQDFCKNVTHCSDVMDFLNIISNIQEYETY